KKAKAPKEPKAKKLSALDAALRVLQEAGQPMTCPEMIEAMAAKGYWTSPGGKTPAATLYSAILRETQTRGDASRSVKTERGKSPERVYPDGPLTSHSGESHHERYHQAHQQPGQRQAGRDGRRALRPKAQGRTSQLQLRRRSGPDRQFAARHARQRADGRADW